MLYPVVSPAKRLSFDEEAMHPLTPSLPEFFSDALDLAATAAKLDRQEIQRLMKISPNLGEQATHYFQSFSADPEPWSEKPAVYAFRGDTFIGLDVRSWSQETAERAQGRLWILSGLYGLLRPFDKIQPYRLEMGSRLQTGTGDNLYQYWGDRITKKLNEVMAGASEAILVNLASQEYFKAVHPKQLNCPVINVVFHEIRDGRGKVMGLHAKRARGMMARHILEKDLRTRAELKEFNLAGYKFNPLKSDENTYIFQRVNEKEPG